MKLRIKNILKENKEERKDMMINRIVDILFDNTEWEFYPWGHEKNNRSIWNNGRDGLVTVWFYDTKDEYDHDFYSKKDVIELVKRMKRKSDMNSRGLSTQHVEEIIHTYGLTEEESVMVLNRFFKRVWETIYDQYWGNDQLDYNS